jgi:hypothetical protein
MKTTYTLTIKRLGTRLLVVNVHASFLQFSSACFQGTGVRRQCFVPTALTAADSWVSPTSNTWIQYFNW